MLDNLSAVPSSGELPGTTEVVIIGGGIVGASAALCLAEAGVPVVLLEKGVIGGEQSSRNWGWVRKMGRDPADVALAIRAEAIWQGLGTRVGEDLGYRVTGSLYPCDTEAELEIQHRWKENVADPNGIGSRLVGADEIRALLTGVKRPFIGGLYTASDGCAEPFLVTPAIARAAQRKGALVFPHLAAKGTVTSGGRVTGVQTERGLVRCSQVVVAGGAWTRKLLRPLGIDFPQLRIHSSVLRTGPVEGAPDICVGASDFALRKRADGGYTIARRNANRTYLTPDHFRLFFKFLPVFRKQRRLVQLHVDGSFFEDFADDRRERKSGVTPYETTRTLDPAPCGAILASGLKNVVDAYPLFAKAEVKEKWAGFIESTPDALPVISRTEAVSGLVVASGFSGHGFGTGPAAGEMVAEIVRGHPTTVPAAPYRIGRFA